MVRTRNLKAVAAAALSLALCEAGLSAEIAMRAAAKEAQDAERLLAASIATQDTTELKILGGKLSRLLGQMPDSEDISIRISCSTSVQQLYNVVVDIRDLPPARRMIAFEHDVKLYREAMPTCERALGLPPPGAPNLR